ncbi:SIS domain-containing protein [Metabacillus sp. RGM 3146]|uniref:SIS domain-containing protein n=1 Tax=Metabacillus sp. RGM 3146 TaxID=3401092 RepID=UPI003B9B24F6
MENSYTFSEIQSQGNTLEKTFVLLKNQTFQASESYVFTGCGTSFYLAHSAAKYFQALTGITSQAAPSSELFLYPENFIPIDKKVKVIAISRSGTTSEAVEAVKSVKDRENVDILAVTCNDHSPLLEWSSEKIVLSHVQEKSVVMTSSFTNMLYALQLYAANIAESIDETAQLKAAAEEMKNVVKSTSAIKSLAENLELKRFIFLGCGVYQGAAKESCLKLKEMTQTICESYSTLEFRHGPISITDEKTAIIIMGSEKTKDLDAALLYDVKKHGAYTVLISDCIIKADSAIDLFIPLHTETKAPNQLVLYLPFLQMLAYYRALALSLNPDEPRHLSQVVKLPSIGIH